MLSEEVVEIIGWEDGSAYGFCRRDNDDMMMMMSGKAMEGKIIFVGGAVSPQEARFAALVSVAVGGGVIFFIVDLFSVMTLSFLFTISCFVFCRVKLTTMIMFGAMPRLLCDAGELVGAVAWPPHG